MRILIADDHELVRETIARFLESEGFEETVSVATLEEALQAVREKGSFDLVLLDWTMPGMNGLEGLKKMIRANDGHPVAILSGTATPNDAQEAIEGGAAGFLPKTFSTASVLSAARFMLTGQVFVPFEFLRQKEAETAGDLTVRETQVLRRLAEGRTNKEIARDLDLQEVTIKLHVRTLCRKLGAKNRTQAAHIARTRRLLPMDDE